MRKGAILLGLLCLPLIGWGQSSFATWKQSDLAAKMDRVIEQQLPVGSDVGIAVYDLTEKRPLYNYRERNLARPASTLKLLTAITALSQPGADEPFRTEVWYRGTIERDTLWGDLYIKGGFDPEFGEEGMRALVAEVAQLPFSVVSGQLLGDVSMKDSLYFGAGWLWDDTPYAYQPYLSPLMYEKGTVKVTVAPGTQTGAAARVTISPASTYYSLTNEAKTRSAAAGKLTVMRDWLSGSNNIRVTGNVQQPFLTELNLQGSAHFFLHTMLDRLRTKGVEVTGGYAFADFPGRERAVQVVAWETPVQQVIDQLLKESDNLNAEALLHRMAARATGRKSVSAADGVALIEALATRLGHAPKSYKIADGCGLSHYDYLSPALLLDFLTYAYASPELYRKLYRALPIAGVDGTLKNRMKRGSGYMKVRAKTGSYTGVNALAGYLKAANGNDIAFVILGQNLLSGAAARTFQDAICELLCAPWSD